MALRKRSYKKDKLISTFLHNTRVQSHKNKLEKEADDKRRSKERNRHERNLAEEKRNELKEQIKEQTLQSRELARKKQKQDNIAARLRSEEIDVRWIDEALHIMEEYGYGLGQVRSKVAPILKTRIEQLLAEEEKEKAAAQVLREQRCIERQRKQAASDAIEGQKRIEKQRVNAASDELIEAASRLSQAIVLQAEALTQELDGLGKHATFGHVDRYLGSINNPMISIERQSNVIGRLFSSVLVAVLLIFLLLLVVLVAIVLLPAQHQMIGVAAGIVIIVFGSIWIIRKRTANFMIKTAPRVALSNEVALSCLTRMLPHETLCIIQEYPDLEGFGFFSDRKSRHYAQMGLPDHNSIDLLRDRLLRLKRFGSRIPSPEKYSPDKLEGHDTLKREIAALTSGEVHTQDGTHG